LIESKPIDNNSICQAIINLNKETILVSSIIENQNIINFMVNESIFKDNTHIKKDYKNNDNNLLRNILSNSSKFLIYISNSNKIKSQYLLLNTEELTYLIIPLTLNDTPNRILAIIYLNQTNIKDENKLIDNVLNYSKSTR
jgi:hypothetical protein